MQELSDMEKVRVYDLTIILAIIRKKGKYRYDSCDLDSQYQYILGEKRQQRLI